MRRSSMVGLAVGIAMIGFATIAAAGDMSGYYGNTVLCKYTNSDVTKVTLEPDGSFAVVPTGHPSSSGKWADDGSTVCYTQTNPPPGPDQKAVCNSSQARKIGDSWAVTDPFGGQCTATLAAGRQ